MLIAFVVVAVCVTGIAVAALCSGQDGPVVGAAAGALATSLGAVALFAKRR